MDLEINFQEIKEKKTRLVSLLLSMTVALCLSQILSKHVLSLLLTFAIAAPLLLLRG